MLRSIYPAKAVLRKNMPGLYVFSLNAAAGKSTFKLIHTHI